LRAAKASRSGRRVGAVAAALLAALVLASCVDLEAEAKIGADGKVSLGLKYSVSRMVAPIASLEARGGLVPLPLTQDGFSKALAGTRGARLDAFSSEESGDELRIRATLGFDDAAALAAFLDSSGERAIYSEREGEKLLRLVLAEGSSPASAGERAPGGSAIGVQGSPGLASAEATALSRAAFSGYEVRLSIETPGPIRSATLSSGEGASFGGSRASYRGETSALVENAQPVLWEIQW